MSVSEVFPLAKVPVAPDDGAVNVTCAPLSNDPFSVTTADNGEPYALPTNALCIEPVCGFMANVGVARFVRPKVADVDEPDAVAVTEYAPAVPFAVKVEVVASPLESEVSVSVVFPFENVPLAPLAGAVKVTDTPFVGDPPRVTTATSGLNAFPTWTLCGPVFELTASGPLFPEPFPPLLVAQPGSNTRVRQSSAVAAIRVFFKPDTFPLQLGLCGTAATPQDRAFLSTTERTMGLFLQEPI